MFKATIIKPAKPNLDIQAPIRRVERLVKKTGDDLEATMRGVTSHFTGGVKYSKDFNSDRDSRTLDFTTNDKRVQFLDGGTSVRKRKMTLNYKAGTRPGSLSWHGRVGRATNRFGVYRGIQARNFSIELIRKHERPFFNEARTEFLTGLSEV